MRPDLGRQLAPDSASLLESHAGGGHDVALVFSDGLSAHAVARHAQPLLAALLPRLRAADWRVAPLTIVRQGRVAIGDAVAQRLGARAVPASFTPMRRPPGRAPRGASSSSTPCQDGGPMPHHHPRVGQKTAFWRFGLTTVTPIANRSTGCTSIPRADPVPSCAIRPFSIARQSRNSRVRD
jgi:hypothetical protein